jgi:hypothetical protein
VQPPHPEIHHKAQANTTEFEVGQKRGSENFGQRFYRFDFQQHTFFHEEIQTKPGFDLVILVSDWQHVLPLEIKPAL